ncbi:hypothetical protein B1A_17345 [mine drainage metagenome]|uniref:Uncharacterized protein n=1 Tax=mine drainage metagenome TaxID=410659 RepID=T1AAC3_9ZZZZ
MAWTLFEVPQVRRTELDELLKDDTISRQSHKLRDAATLGRPSGSLLVLIEGAPEAIALAEERLRSAGTPLPKEEAERVYRALREEDDTASAGMGLFFTE